WSGSALPPDGTVVDAVNAALIAARIDPTQAVPLSPTPTPVSCPTAVIAGSCTNASGTAPSAEITICRNVLLDPASTAPGACGVIISFQYPYQQKLPFASIDNQQFFLKARVEMKAED